MWILSVRKKKRMDAEQMTSSVCHWVDTQQCQEKCEIRKTIEYVSQGTGRLLVQLPRSSKEWAMMQPRLWYKLCILEPRPIHLSIWIWPGYKQHRLYPGRCVPHPAISAYRSISHPHERKKTELVKILTELAYHGNKTFSFPREYPWGWASRLEGHHLGRDEGQWKETKAERISKQRPSNSPSTSP